MGLMAWLRRRGASRAADAPLALRRRLACFADAEGSETPVILGKGPRLDPAIEADAGWIAFGVGGRRYRARHADFWRAVGGAR